MVKDFFERDFWLGTVSEYSLIRGERADRYTMGDSSYFHVRWFGESERLFTVSHSTTM